MENAHLNKDFTRYSDGDLLTEADHVVESMTGNNNFANPNPALDDVASAATDYQSKLGKAKDGIHADTLAKNASREALETALAALAVWCNARSTDAGILATTGMQLSKIKGKIGTLTKPEDFKVEPGSNKGSVKLSLKTIDHADFYEFQFTAAPGNASSVWLTRTSRKKTIIIDGLLSGSEYAFRAAGAGSDTSRIWSNILTSVVL